MFEEERAEEARTLLLQFEELAAPSLLYYELTNIARTKALRNPGLRELIAQQLQAALEIEVALIEIDPLAVFELTLETRLSAYDASYLAAARQLDARLLTFDDTLAAAAP